MILYKSILLFGALLTTFFTSVISGRPKYMIDGTVELQFKLILCTADKSSILPQAISKDRTFRFSLDGNYWDNRVFIAAQHTYDREIVFALYLARKDIPRLRVHVRDGQKWFPEMLLNICDLTPGSSKSSEKVIPLNLDANIDVERPLEKTLILRPSDSPTVAEWRRIPDPRIFGVVLCGPDGHGLLRAKVRFEDLSLSVANEVGFTSSVVKEDSARWVLGDNMGTGVYIVYIYGEESKVLNEVTVQLSRKAVGVVTKSFGTFKVGLSEPGDFLRVWMNTTPQYVQICNGTGTIPLESSSLGLGDYDPRKSISQRESILERIEANRNVPRQSFEIIIGFDAAGNPRTKKKRPHTVIHVHPDYPKDLMDRREADPIGAFQKFSWGSHWGLGIYMGQWTRPEDVPKRPNYVLVGSTGKGLIVPTSLEGKPWKPEGDLMVVRQPVKVAPMSEPQWPTLELIEEQIKSDGICLTYRNDVFKFLKEKFIRK